MLPLAENFDTNNQKVSSWSGATLWCVASKVGKGCESVCVVSHNKSHVIECKMALLVATVSLTFLFICNITLFICNIMLFIGNIMLFIGDIMFFLMI